MHRLQTQALLTQTIFITSIMYFQSESLHPALNNNFIFLNHQDLFSLSSFQSM